jgi:hypothetical protein
MREFLAMHRVEEKRKAVLSQYGFDTNPRMIIPIVVKPYPAARFDEKYSDKVNTFNWERLYSRSPSLNRLFAERLTERYKYVLLDSRTGLTDLSGICTASEVGIRIHTKSSKLYWDEDFNQKGNKIS